MVWKGKDEPPAPPGDVQALSVSPALQSLSLSWTAPTDADFALDDDGRAVVIEDRRLTQTDTVGSRGHGGAGHDERSLTFTQWRGRRRTGEDRAGDAQAARTSEGIGGAQCETVHGGVFESR